MEDSELEVRQDRPSVVSPEGRSILLGTDLPVVPERLLLAHARGEVLFITGAGISMPAGLPDFRQLVLDVYRRVDAATHAILISVPTSACNLWDAGDAALLGAQRAEVRRFIQGDYDVVLGLLERRMDQTGSRAGQVRKTIAEILARAGATPGSIHKSLVKLADRGGVTTIVTTNFDLLLERAARHQRPHVRSFSLGEIPRPHRRPDFCGVLHIHGCLQRHAKEESAFLVTDHDLGEYYLRRRMIPDLIYDAARLFHLVLVGYSANDAPMRYLLNAVAADGSRFDDLKERFAFVGMTPAASQVSKQDWLGRGITPVPYDTTNGHGSLAKLLDRWASLSPINARRSRIEAEIRRIVRLPRSRASAADRDLFEHLVRRSSNSERVRFCTLMSEARASHEWLDLLMSVSLEPSRS